jgi:hypothetical protein
VSIHPDTFDLQFQTRIFSLTSCGSLSGATFSSLSALISEALPPPICSGDTDPYSADHATVGVAVMRAEDVTRVGSGPVLRGAGQDAAAAPE